MIYWPINVNLVKRDSTVPQTMQNHVLPVQKDLEYHREVVTGVQVRNVSTALAYRGEYFSNKLRELNPVNEPFRPLVISGKVFCWLSILYFTVH